MNIATISLSCNEALPKRLIPPYDMLLGYTPPVEEYLEQDQVPLTINTSDPHATGVKIVEIIVFTSPE